MRLPGLASGMDTDLMVSEMMKAERLKLDKYSQGKQTNLWKQADYQRMNKEIANFILNSQKNMGLKKTSSTGLMVNQSYKTLDYMRIAKSSNMDAASVRVAGKAENGTFNLKVDKLAESSYLTTAAIDDINAKIDVTEGEAISVAGVIIFEGSENEGEGITGRELLKKINNNKDLKDMGVSAFYDNGTKSIFLQGDAGLDLTIRNYSKGGPESSKIISEKILTGEVKVDGIIVGTSPLAGSTVNSLKERLKDKLSFELKVGEAEKRSFKLSSDWKSQLDLDEHKKTTKAIKIGSKEFAAGSKFSDIESYIRNDYDDLKLDEKVKINETEIEAGKTFKDIEEALSGNIKEVKKLATPITIDGKAYVDLDKLITVLDGFNEGKKYEEYKSYTIKDGEISVFSGGEVFQTAKESQGSKGQATINGIEFKALTNNKLKFNGLEIEMKADGVSTITVDTNYDEIVDKIKGLVDEYNSLIEEVSKTISQKRYKDYHPLSMEEKGAMKENDVKLWEEKAKSGLLNNDDTLKRMLNNTRSDMYRTVEGLEGSFSHITQIGISTEKYAKGTTGGKLQIDEEKLRKALAEDTDGVMELLFGKGKEENLKPNPDNGGKKELSSGATFNGVFTGIYDNMVNSMKDVINKSGPGEDSDLLRDVRSNILIDFVSYKGSISDLDRSILDMEKKMSDMEVLFARKEESYYKRFTAMEKSLQKMNSQSSWIGQQMM